MFLASGRSDREGQICFSVHRRKAEHEKSIRLPIRRMATDETPAPCYDEGIMSAWNSTFAEVKVRPILIELSHPLNKQ